VTTTIDAPGLSQHNSHVFAYLDYYIGFSHAPHYGVLLDGPWGIGKTYLVKKFLKHKFGEDKRQYTYISLFGLKNLDEIDDALYAAAHPVLTSKGMKVAGKLTKALLKYKDIDIDIDFDIKEFLSNRSTNVFIFDDLERAEMDTNEVLGYINEFVEHDGCKVIIIANQAELKDKGEYARRKEKIVGKTLKVESSLEEALNHFIEQVDDKAAKNFLESKKGMVAAIYYLSGLHNLRVLQQSLWDFQRLYGAMTDEHKSNERALDACLQLFLSLSIAFKSGQITDKNLLERPNGIIAAMRDQHISLGSSNGFQELEKKYVGISLYDSVLSNEVLDSVLSRGDIPTMKIRECLDASVYFATIEKEPSWRTVWYFIERSEDEFRRGLAEMTRQFISREFTRTGEILHVFGLRLWLSSTGLIDDTKQDVVEQGKKYVDDLFEQGQLTPTDERISSSDRLYGYDGLGVYEKESDEFIELFKYLNEKQIATSEKRLPEEAEHILSMVAKNQEDFYQRVCMPPSGQPEKNYYNIEVMVKIEPTDFVTTLLNLHPLKQKTVLLALSARYSHGHLSRHLPNEKVWIEAVKNSIEKERSSKSVSESSRLGKVIEWYVDPILRTDEE
jgi:GTPase SAR1 family protein